MSRTKFPESLIYRITEKLLAVPQTKIPPSFYPQKILIIRQHNQLGDILAGVPLFRGLKEKFPGSEITLIAGTQNYYGVEKNKFIDELFVFNKKRLFNPFYLRSLHKVLNKKYDIVIVPVTVSVSFTSNLISRFSDAVIRLGPASLDGRENKSSFLFNVTVPIDWRRQPDSNVSERIMDIVRPLNISVADYRSEITFDESDTRAAEKFITSLNKKESDLLIGLHVGAGKKQNRWSLKKYVNVIEELKRAYPSKFYFTGGKMDNEEIEYMRGHLKIAAGYFLNRKIPEVAALIALSDLFITNDTGIMHVAGTTDTAQISVFGPTNPYNWAPVGKNKYFIRKSDFIDDINEDDVLEICRMVLDNKMGR